MKSVTRASVIGLLAAALGCNGPNSTYQEIGDRVNTDGFGHRYQQPEDQEELVLGPGDVLSVQIANDPTLNSQQRISIEGTIQGPFIGSVKVAGLTSSQIQDKLQIYLTPYITGVSVVVAPIAIQSKRIYVYATDIQGGLRGRAYPLTGDLTLIDLITAIGGINYIADGCHVKVTRGDPRHPKVRNINVYDMIVNGNLAGNIQLHADDIVFLQPTFFAQIAQTLNAVTLPIRSVGASLQSAASTVFFIENGTLPRGRTLNNGF